VKLPSARRVAVRYASQKVYRGLVVDVASAGLASAIRKAVVRFALREPSGMSEGEVARFIVGAIKMNDIGESWSVSRRSAEKFGRGDYALGRRPTPRGKTLGVLLSGEVKETAGYDPVDAGEEVWQMTMGENEVRLRPGTSVKVTGLDVYIPKFKKDKYTGFTNDVGRWYYLHLGGKSFKATV
jgi:hypothetical protein